MELLIEFWNKLKSGIKVLLNYLYIILGMGVFFTLGYYYNTLKELSKLGKPEFITREEVTVALDENNNFMIIDKTKSKSEITFTDYEDAYSPGFEDMVRRVPDISKIIKFTGWKPILGLEKIIEDVSKSYT